MNNNLIIENNNGTAHLVFSDNNILENIKTLDGIIDQYPKFRDVNILKIDTDGFEIAVLDGGRDLLREKHPVIFFEFTPEAYINSNKKPMDLIRLLNKHGYNNALFYDNFGVAKGIYDFNDEVLIQKEIEKIDNKEIYYYDILCVHKADEEKYMNIFKYEMG